MAESQVEVVGTGKQLKHLDFVRILAINAVVLVSGLYGYAKQNSGSLKSSVGTVENAVKAVVGPVYERFKGVPSDILIFIDKKVDVAAQKFDELAPPAAKKVAAKAHIVIEKATQVAQELNEEARVDGPVAALIHAGEISKQFTLNQLAVVWYKANTYPTLHSLSQLVVPTAIYWSEKYNTLVKELKAKGYTLFYYVPLVPVEEIAQSYKQVEASADKKTDAPNTTESESESESTKE